MIESVELHVPVEFNFKYMVRCGITYDVIRASSVSEILNPKIK